MGTIDQTASRIGHAGDLGELGTAYLLVVDGDSSSIFHLPRCGAVVIGRGAEAELRVTHASVSRRHATIRVDDNVIRVADLDSHNGTAVNGVTVTDSRVLASGDVVTVGDVVLVVHFSEARPIARPAYGEAGWRRRLAEELERAIAYERPLGILAVVGSAEALAPMANRLRLMDVVGHADDGTALVALPELDREAARRVAIAAIDGASGLRAGLAMCPTDACDVDTILILARAAARQAEPGSVVDAASAATRIELGDRHVLLADPAMQRVFALLGRLATSELAILITGETGVGKENAAFAVHHWSKRKGPFVPVNCAAIGPESLVESELFGHEKGAFTGAVGAKAGLFESAAGGTVFLDEVGELPLAIQAKLLRAIEARKITRLGESRERDIDVRLVAATNRSLDDEVRAGRFRQDLHFRIGGATVILPPLRDRRCEIPLLAAEFLRAACTRSGRAPMTIAAATAQVLLTHTWPGNVRELKNTMEYVMAAAPDGTVEPSDLPERLGGVGGASPTPTPATPELGADVKASFQPIAEEIRTLERKRMVEALAASKGVRTRAAQLIDMPIRTFTLKLKQYKL
jgi:two-component system, NtrC family, response regulator AtoC